MLRALLLLLFLKASQSEVTLEKICVKSGEMVALECLGPKSLVTWSIPQSSDQSVLLKSNRSLVILSASESHQGNYSCGGYKAFELTVYTTLPSDCRNITLYPQTCEDGAACTLDCPKVYTPITSTKITSKGVTWQKEGRFKDTVDFSSVRESDQGVYSCVWSFGYYGHVYNKTFSVELVVKPQQTIQNENIIEPPPNKVFPVDVGSPLVINCTAVLFSDLDEVYWQIENTPVSKSSTSRIYSNYASSGKLGVGTEGEKMTASLVFNEVSDEDLSTVFTCKLESTSQRSEAVNVTLAKKARPSYVAVTIVAVVVPVVFVVLVLISIKYKIHITLFLRDTLGFNHRLSDGKSFDACIMHYTSEQEAGLSDDHMKTLQNMLEDHFGYSLCLFDRDVLPGKAVADVVLECVEQSRAVLLVPASPALNNESALLSAVHEALVERQTRLVFIRDKSTETTGAHPVPPETLQLLMDLGHCVTWRGSFEKSSFFWKQLRYYLPPVQQYHKISLLPQIV